MPVGMTLGGKAAWGAGAAGGAILAGVAWGWYTNWAPITVVLRGATVVFACGPLVTVMPIADVQRMSVEVLAQGIETDAAEQNPDRAVPTRARTLAAAQKALKMIKDTRASITLES